MGGEHCAKEHKESTSSSDALSQYLASSCAMLTCFTVRVDSTRLCKLRYYIIYLILAVQSAFPYYQIFVSVVINPGFCSLACCLFLQNFVRQDFGGAQGLDGILVLQDVALGRVQDVQDLVLNVFQVFLVLVDLEKD